MGAAGAFVQNMTYLTLFSTQERLPMYVAAVSSVWAIGLIIGGPIGSIFARDFNWRWAIYFPIPCVGAALILGVLCIPNYSFVFPQVSILQRLMHIDPLGLLLNMLVPFLFAIAVTFPNVVWDWLPGSYSVLWTIFGLFCTFWIAQQHWCLLTRPEERALPIHILPRTDLLPIWISTACAGSTYAITIYYTPLFYAFCQGLDAIDQMVKLLPFTLIFIFTAMLTGRLLSVMKLYGVIYVSGGFIVANGSVIMAALMSKKTVTGSQIMGLEALIGVGLGLHFQHGLAISDIINKSRQDRIDSLLICNMAQMGGIAVTLAVAGSLFQNIGYDLLLDALGQGAFSPHEIREALAGVTSTVRKNPLLLEKATEAVAVAISREFFISTSAGLICLFCGLCMSGKFLD
ncbi:efflux pump antibiotic resistance protein [Pochonia chlamydosporia 170]|uniref:Efflux pump antibiotic resistance protein n=1 Tax=Pochonia chlamydosporia 170 TaxID=1380566 RepID=A0A179F438_METCM|nr:efflux pump antibiotic resistance protein [Pochonia chlamydosporia 170]OAQ60188.1 efflux pump antibiotic resistance protein [Pochonia chlamydosporia 170]